MILFGRLARTLYRYLNTHPPRFDPLAKRRARSSFLRRRLQKRSLGFFVSLPGTAFAGQPPDYNPYDLCAAYAKPSSPVAPSVCSVFVHCISRWFMLPASSSHAAL